MSAPDGPGGLRRVPGLRDLVLLDVVAIVGLRWLSTAAQLGLSSLVLWLLAPRRDVSHLPSCRLDRTRQAFMTAC